MKKVEVKKAKKEVVKKDAKKVLLPSVEKPWLKYYNEDQINAKLPYNTIYDYLYECNKDHLDDMALYYFNRSWTFGEMFEEIDKCAKSFIYLGINKKKKRDIVTMCTPNTPEAVFTFYALVKIGAVVNMIHPMSSHLEIKNYLIETSSKFFVAYEGVVPKKRKSDKTYTLDKIDSIIRRTDVEKVIVLSPSNYMNVPLKMMFNLNISRNKSGNYSNNNKYAFYKEFIGYSEYIDDLDVSVSPEDLAVLFHTGGTTGSPKAVEITHDIFNSSISQIQLDNPLAKRGDTTMLIMPLFHGFGLSNCLHLAMCSGISGVLMPKFSPKMFEAEIKKHNPELILGVPTIFDAYMNLKCNRKRDLSHLTYLISGGDKISNELEDSFNEFLRDANAKQPILKAFGLSEAVAATTRTNKNITEFNNTLKSGMIVESSCVGIPFVKNNFKIVSIETGEELGYNEHGEICISGPSVMRGYYNNKAETSATLKEEDGAIWLHTGDLGFIDEVSSCIFYTERHKRMIVTNGYNVYPSQIEFFANMLSEVKDSHAVGIPHAKKGSLPVLYIILNEDVIINSKAEVKQNIMNALSRNLSGFAIPKDIVIIDKFPLTPLNKLDTRALVKDYDVLKKEDSSI